MAYSIMYGMRSVDQFWMGLLRSKVIDLIDQRVYWTVLSPDSWWFGSFVLLSEGLFLLFIDRFLTQISSTSP